MSESMESATVIAGGEKRRCLRSQKRAWVIAIVIAVVVHGVALSFFQLSEPESSAKQEMPSKVLLAGIDRTVDQMLKEQLEFSDHKPLFLPTKWNYANSEKFSVKSNELVEIFGDYEPSFLSSEGVAGDLVQISEEMIEDPIDALEGGDQGYAEALGRRDDPIKPVSARMAAFAVYSATGGNLVFSAEVILREEVEGSVPIEGIWWEPLEFLLLIDVTGPVGRPLLTLGSGVEEVDDFFRSFVSFQLNLKGKLGPGYYRVLIGP